MTTIKNRKPFKKIQKKLKKQLTEVGTCSIIKLVVGVSPNGKATDSDSVISRFESLYPS